MSKFQTAASGCKLISFTGQLRILSESDGWKQKVELWLLNSEVNRNNWKYENLEAHKDLFAETPILIAYVGEKIGDGHNFKEIKNADGSVSASFMEATAERIVGYFQSKDDIRIDEREGKQWIVGTGYIWKWYARELVKKLERQGLQGMPISIETLIDEMHMNGTTEVFTRYQILGTTILGDDVSPAVENANIRALSAIGSEEVRRMTLRVASKNEKSQNHNPQEKVRKGETKTMELKELQPKFNGYTVVAVDGEKVALLSTTGVPHLSTAKKDGDDYVIGEKDEVRANAAFTQGKETFEVPVEAIVAPFIARCNEMEKELTDEREAKGNLEKALGTMQKAENARRKKAVSDAIKNRLNEIRESNESCDISENACDELLTDEKIAAYAEMEKENGDFCGDETAKKDVDSICMNSIVSANRSRMNSKKNRFAWENTPDGYSDGDDGVSKAIADILK